MREFDDGLSWRAPSLFRFYNKCWGRGKNRSHFLGSLPKAGAARAWRLYDRFRPGTAAPDPGGSGGRGAGGGLCQLPGAVRSHKKKSGPQGRSFSLSKKPRRVRTRRCEKDEICFFRRHVRRKKHFSARKCASCPLKADSECAQRAASLFEKVARPLFRQSRRRVLGRGAFWCFGR